MNPEDWKVLAGWVEGNKDLNFLWWTWMKWYTGCLKAMDTSSNDFALKSNGGSYGTFLKIQY